MSNYKRLISYIYVYEGGIKGKNVGFAKIEMRGGQCKIGISVKKIYVGGNDIGVFLLAEKKEIYLGNIFIRNGGGEFRAMLSEANMEGTGISMDQCYGLTIHDVESKWQTYTTIWEDAVAHAAEVELSEVTAANRILQNQKEQERQQRISGLSTKSQTPVKEKEPLREVSMSEEITQTQEARPAEQPEPVRQAKQRPQPVPIRQPEPVPQPEPVRQPEPTSQPEPASQPEPTSQPEPIRSVSTDSEEKPHDSSEASLPEPGDPSRLEVLAQQEIDGKNHNDIWEDYQKKYPKVRAFDYEHGCEIISISPQDLGILPRENWVYGNNSFLLHGYYNYRHIIIAQLNNPEGKSRYLLGVPGHYYSSEKYMAAMFGFPNFVLAKNQQQPDGRFGYWYTDIQI